MSDVLCVHICDCTCHGPILHRGPGPELGKKHLIELPPAPMHVVACCAGLCPGGCRDFIKHGMKRDHLMECHKMTAAEADKLIERPAVANAARQRVIDSMATG